MPENCKGTRIDDVRVIVWDPRPGDRLRAVVDFSLNGEWAIWDVRIVEAPDGRLLVVMPDRQLRDGRFIPVVHPINSECRRAMEKAVLAAYVEKVREMAQHQFDEVRHEMQEAG